MKRRRSAPPKDPLWEYEGSTRRADGAKPYNHHLWPLDCDWWWLDRDRPRLSFSSRWNFSVVALQDGRYATTGSVHSIDRGKNLRGQVVVCADRTAAIRVSAARLICVMRGSREWHGHNEALTGKRLAFAINWVLQVVARETSALPSRAVSIPEKPPAPQPTGLPLFDHGHF